MLVYMCADLCIRCKSTLIFFIIFQEGGHDNRVNDVCWSEDDSTLYSCSNDKHIIEWNTENGQRKW